MTERRDTETQEEVNETQSTQTLPKKKQPVNKGALGVDVND